jgi:hypothetical protein
MDYLTKRPEVCVIHNQEASMVVDVLVTNFFCFFRVPRELHNKQSWNFKS